MYEYTQSHRAQGGHSYAHARTDLTDWLAGLTEAKIGADKHETVDTARDQIAQGGPDYGYEGHKLEPCQACQ